MNFYEIQYAKRKIEPKMSSFLVKRNEAFNCVWKGVRVYLSFVIRKDNRQ